MGLFSSQISTSRMVPLCRQLATSDAAGLPIVRTLELVGHQMKDRKIRDVLAQINADIRRGSTLAEATRKQSKYLPRFFIELMATGERGGRLDIMLRELADYYEDRLSIQRRIKSAMFFPMLELVAAWYLGSFAIMIIRRALGAFQAGSGQSFNFADFFREYFAFQGKVLIGAGVIFAICVILSRLGVFKWIWGFFATYIWPLSSVTRGFGLARFFRSMSLLTGAGLNILDVVDSAAAVVVNPYIERDLREALPRLKRGDTLLEAFAPSRYIPRMNLEMVHTGETTGNLEEMLRKAAEYNLEEATQASHRLISVMTVLVILGVAVVVGAVIITFYMNIFSMYDSLLQ
jgi:type IV pilus assembly protein PilC